MKKMWGEDSVWKTEAKFWSWLRGGLRRAVWNKHPTKLALINRSRFKAPLGKGQAEVWCLECEMCSEVYRQNECQVDHIAPAGGLKSIADITPFIEKLAFISLEDIRILCKKCHAIVTYSERYGVTLDEARKRKAEIAKRKKRER